MVETKKSAVHRWCLSSPAQCWIVLAFAFSASAALADEWHWSGVKKVVAISDVHGAYDAMENTLQQVGMLNETLAWTAGDTHLVITGDLLDRGPDSRKVMDLIMVLEPQAEAAGGAVHLLLGNHEVMNLVGDLRYVSTEEYAAFIADELPEERERWLRIYRDQKLMVTDEEALRAEFNESRPPGFYGHRRAFRSDGKYGSWLLEKPLIVVINDTAYVHGGLSPLVARLGLEGINGTMKSDLVTYVGQMGVLNDAGILDPAESFYDHKSVLEAVAATEDHVLAAAIGSVISLSDGAIHDTESPLWYRGNAACGPLIEIERIDPALKAIGANRVVIGHTPTLTRRILSRLSGRVVEIDTGMLKSSYGGSGNALVIQGGTMTVINESGPEVLAAVDHPRRVGLRAESISADVLQKVLLNGSIVAVGENDSQQSSVKVSYEGVTVDAVFTANPRAKAYVPEIAAYRLDRLLELNMVPVTVRRKIDGTSGTLQFRPKSLLDEAQRSAGRRGSSAMCPLPSQWNTMYIFDALIYNPGRGPQYILYSPDNFQLILAGHNTSFDKSRSLPSYIKKIELDVGSVWQEKLAALSDDVLDEKFGDVLDRRRLKALSSRRDKLLEDATR